MALNLSRNTKVFVSSVNGVHASGGCVKTIDVIGGVNASHAVGDIVTFNKSFKAIVAAVTSGRATSFYLPNNFRGTGIADNEVLTSSATSGSGTNGLTLKVNGVTSTTTEDGGRVATGLFKGNGTHGGNANAKKINTFRVGVLDGYSFSQGSEATDVTINEAGATPNRGSKRFNDSLPPAEWSFSTYVRPFKHGTNSWREAGDMDMVENILWASIAGKDICDGSLSGTSSSAVIVDSTSADVDFVRSEHHELLKLNIFFALENTTYRLNDAQVNQCEIDFSIDGIAQLSWSGNATTIDQITEVIEDPSKTLHIQNGNTAANAATVNGADTETSVATFVEGYNYADSTGPDDADYLRNKLSTLTLAALVQGGGKSSGGLDARTYDINITGGSITIANNVTYVTPETLGVIDKSIGSFTGARTITGSLTCYLDTKSNGSNQLLSDMAAATDLVSNVFNMSLFMGGASSAVPVVEFDIPRAHLQVPTLETGDIISTSVEFSAHGSTLLDGDEMSIKYKGLTAHTDSRYTTDLTV
jgi:hypothetical protein